MSMIADYAISCIGYKLLSVVMRYCYWTHLLPYYELGSTALVGRTGWGNWAAAG